MYGEKIFLAVRVAKHGNKDTHLAAANEIESLQTPFDSKFSNSFGVMWLLKTEKKTCGGALVIQTT